MLKNFSLQKALGQQMLKPVFGSKADDLCLSGREIFFQLRNNSCAYRLGNLVDCQSCQSLIDQSWRNVDVSQVVLEPIGKVRRALFVAFENCSALTQSAVDAVARIQ